jgi:hypothetical protein
MAALIPSMGSVIRRMTPGERRFAQRLEAKLEEDYLCWYDVPVGPRGLHPDFIVLHPLRGLLILEVKDWRLETVQHISRISTTILTAQGAKEVMNPLEQARHYAQAVADLLRGDSALRVPARHRYEGHLRFPYGYGVVLTNICRRTFEASGMNQAMDGHLVVCQDEMLEAVDAEDFQQRLWAMFTVLFPRTLTVPEIERIRWHLFPEIRIQQGGLFGSDENKEESPPPDLIAVMDLQQEQLARSLGGGHRVIHGVAGSGKTLILGYRCMHLAKVLRQPILVLCYNVTLASRLRHLIDARGLGAQVIVRNLHGWCSDQLKHYHVALPPDGTGFYERIVQAVIDGLERGQIPAGQYGAVMVDEAHDFRPEWLKLIAQMVDPTTDSLLILYDDAQSIYGASKRRGFSFASVGILAQGRTTILKLNYRNTSEILTVAYEFAKEALRPHDADEDGVPLVYPEAGEVHGPVPELIRLPTLADEGAYLARTLKRLHREGMVWSDMAVLYRTKFVAEEVITALEIAAVPVDWITEGRKSRHYQPSAESVKVITMHSSKGLEFPVVAIPGLGFLPHDRAEPTEEARLLYVAMTRAMNRLVMTHHRTSSFVQRLERVLARTSGSQHVVPPSG